MLKQVLELHPTLSLENHYYQRYTPLMEAVFLEKNEMVEYICKHIKEKYTINNKVQSEYKKYLNQINIEGKTAIMIAVLSNESIKIIKFLIDEGANISAKDREGKDIFYYSSLACTNEVEDFISGIKK